jgi:hypothetical protein
MVHAAGAVKGQRRGRGPDPVSEGLLEPVGQSAADWRFSGHALWQTRRALRLARDLELNPGAVAVVMALLAEIDSLQSLLQRRSRRGSW